MLRADMIKTKKFIIVERTQMNAIFKEQGLQMTGCTDQECAVQAGKLLSANKILIGEIGIVEKTIIITIRIVDVERGVSEFAEKETASRKKDIVKAVNRLSKRLSETIDSSRVPIGYYYRAVVPGWGQFYAGSRIKGFIYSGSFLFAGGFLTFAHVYYAKKRKDYNNLPENVSQDIYDDKYKKSKRAGYISITSIGLIALVYTANWIDIIFFTRDNFSYSTANNMNLSLPMNIYFSVNPFRTKYNFENTIELNMVYKF